MVVTRRKKPEVAGVDATTPNASVKEDAAAAGAEEACVEVKGDEGHRAAKRAKHSAFAYRYDERDLILATTGSNPCKHTPPLRLAHRSKPQDA